MGTPALFSRQSNLCTTKDSSLLCIMVRVKSYPLSPSKLIPNSPFPLLHYPGLLSDKADCNTSKVYDLFTANGWEINWIFRYGPTQRSHYHSKAHECMAVLSGTATIRFG